MTAIYSVLTIIFNFLITALIVRYLGFGHSSDQYFLFSSLTLTSTMVISWSFSSISISVINSANSADDRELIKSKILGVYLSSLVFFFSGTLLFYFILSYFYSLNIVVFLFLLLTISFDFISSCYITFLRSDEKFSKSILIPCISSFITLLFLMFLYIYDNHYVNDTFFISIFIFLPKLVQFLVITIFYKTNLPIIFNFSFIIKYISDIKSLLFLSIFTRSNELLEKSIATVLGEGFLSFFAVFQRFSGACNTVLVNTFSIQTMNKFVDIKKRSKNTTEIKKQVLNLLYHNGIIFFSSSIFFFLFVYFGKNIIFYIFNYEYTLDYNAFNVVLALSIILFLKCFNQTLHNIFFAFEMVSDVSMIDFLVFFVTAFSKFILVFYFGIEGFLFSCVIDVSLLTIVRLTYLKLKLGYV